MIKAAITGNIGMGKSHVLKAFQHLGAYTINSDEIVAKLLTIKKVVDDIRFILGPSVITPQGTLNKKRVAEIIFSNEDMKHSVEAILHPLVFNRVNQLLSESEAEVAVVEVPMLFEGNYEGEFKRIITVYTEANIAIDRLLEAGMNKEDIARRMANQIPITEKVSKSDFTIDNNGAPGELLPRVKQIYRALQAEH